MTAARLLPHIGRDVPQLLVILLLGASTLVALDGLHDFATVAASRLLEPYPLAWVEPVFVRSVLQAWAGLPLYGPLDPSYVPSIYNPGVALAGGLLFRLTGPGLAPLRLLCFAPLLLLLGLLAAWVGREAPTGSGLLRRAAWATVAVGAAVSVSTPLHDWLTQVNADVPSFLLALLAAWLVRRTPTSSWRAVGAGVALALAFACKQGAAFLALAVLLHLLTTRQLRAALLLALACGGLCGAGAAVALLQPGSTWWESTVLIPALTARREELEFWRTVLQDPSLAVLATALLALLPVLVLRGGPQGRLLAWLVLATLVAGDLGVGKLGGARNSLLPLYFLAALLLGLAPGLLAWPAGPDRGPDRESAPPVAQLAVLLPVLVLLHVGFAGTAKRAEVVRGAATRAAAQGKAAAAVPTYPALASFEQRIRDAVRQTPGEVLVGARCSQQQELGRPLNFHQSTLLEWTARTHLRRTADLLGRPLAAHRWSKLILWDFKDEPELFALVGRSYRKERTLGKDPFLGMDVTVWVPR